jgi:hypothetical protein
MAEAGFRVGEGVAVGDGLGVGTGVGDGVVPGVGVAVGVGVGLDPELTEPHPVARAKMKVNIRTQEHESSLCEFIEYLKSFGGEQACWVERCAAGDLSRRGLG